MRTRHAIVVGFIGLAMSAAPVAFAAPASAAATAPCPNLLGCTLTSVTSTVGGLTANVTTTVNNTVSTVIKDVVPPPPSTQPSPSPTVGVATSLTRLPPQHLSGGQGTKPTTSASGPSRTVPFTGGGQSGKGSQGSGGGGGGGGGILPLIDDVRAAIQTVASLFGWNLLALIPMAAIAFVISRRMGSSRRRSVSGLI